MTYNVPEIEQIFGYDVYGGNMIILNEYQKSVYYNGQYRFMNETIFNIIEIINKKKNYDEINKIVQYIKVSYPEIKISDILHIESLELSEVDGHTFRFTLCYELVRCKNVDINFIMKLFEVGILIPTDMKFLFEFCSWMWLDQHIELIELMFSHNLFDKESIRTYRCDDPDNYKYNTSFINLIMSQRSFETIKNILKYLVKECKSDIFNIEKGYRQDMDIYSYLKRFGNEERPFEYYIQELYS